MITPLPLTSAGPSGPSESAEDVAVDVAAVHAPDVAPDAPRQFLHSSPPRTVMHLAREAMAPPVDVLTGVASTAWAAARQACRPSGSALPLQQALAADLSEASHQAAAHAAALDYGRRAAERLDRALPFLHTVARIGIASTALTFGLGRNSGLAAADATVRAVQGRPQSLEVFDAPPPPVPASLADTALSVAAPWVLGSAAGATGHLVGELLASPLIGLIPRQFQVIDARAVVPDTIVRDMNALRPGAGDALRQAVTDRQRAITALTSDSNIVVGKAMFGLTAVARASALGATPLGVAGLVSVGLATSTVAGLLVGAAMALRQSVATLRVPDAGRLSALVHAQPTDGAAALAALMAAVEAGGPEGHDVPLFYARRSGVAPPSSAPEAAPEADAEATPEAGPAPMIITVVDEAQRDCLTRMREGLAQTGNVLRPLTGWLTRPAHAVATQFRNGLLMDPLPTVDGASAPSAGSRVVHSGLNVMSSGLRRTRELLRATWHLSLISAATSAVARPLQGAEQRAALAIGGAIGIQTAIRPWFTSVTERLPAAHRLIREERQAAVDAQARARLKVVARRDPSDA